MLQSKGSLVQKQPACDGVSVSCWAAANRPETGTADELAGFEAWSFKLVSI